MDCVDRHAGGGHPPRPSTEAPQTLDPHVTIRAAHLICEHSVAILVAESGEIGNGHVYGDVNGQGCGREDSWTLHNGELSTFDVVSCAPQCSSHSFRYDPYQATGPPPRA